MLTLYIANKNYSSWSMRAWVLLKQAGIPFEEHFLAFDEHTFDATGPSAFKATLKPLSPVGKVPVLVDDSQTLDGQALTVWDTLAIAEYIAEAYPEKKLMPQTVSARARMRSLCAEMHSGFMALRSKCMMNIEANLPHIGALAMRDNPALRADIARIDAIWSASLDDHLDGLLFGHFTVADAYFAPVVMRFKSYGLPLSPKALAYAKKVEALPAVQMWVEQALAEKRFLAVEEPYRLQAE